MRAAHRRVIRQAPARRWPTLRRDCSRCKQARQITREFLDEPPRALSCLRDAAVSPNAGEHCAEILMGVGGGGQLVTDPASTGDSVGLCAPLDSVMHAGLWLVKRLVVRNAPEIAMAVCRGIGPGSEPCRTPAPLGRTALNAVCHRPGCLKSVHPSHICHIAADDQGHFSSIAARPLQHRLQGANRCNPGQQLPTPTHRALSLPRGGRAFRRAQTRWPCPVQGARTRNFWQQIVRLPVWGVSHTA